MASCFSECCEQIPKISNLYQSLLLNTLYFVWLFQILAWQYFLWTEIFHDNLTLPKSAEKCWLERDLNSHLRDTRPPLYLLSYRVHGDWRRVLIQLKCMRYSRDNLTLYPWEDVPCFSSISESSSEIYMKEISHEKFLLIYISEDDSKIVFPVFT